MSLARLVVIEGPDAGREFEVPLRGGGVGRGDNCLIKLTDPMVSRQHGLIELRDGAMSFVAEAGKAVLINRAPVDVHRLEAGDEIVIGATKLAYLAVDGGVAVTRVSANVTRCSVGFSPSARLQLRTTSSTRSFSSGLSSS